MDIKNYNYAKTLAFRWRTSKKKIEEKLYMKGNSANEVESIINKLEEENYLSDEKSFELVLFGLENKRYGYKRIKDNLIEKGFPRDLIDEYKFDKEVERENCHYYFSKIVKKYKNYKYFDSEREKIINYLKRYGFNDKIIFEIVKAGINYENVS